MGGEFFADLNFSESSEKKKKKQATRALQRGISLKLEYRRIFNFVQNPHLSWVSPTGNEYLLAYKIEWMKIKWHGAFESESQTASEKITGIGASERG